jgi:hypothetical protein
MVEGKETTNSLTRNTMKVDYYIGSRITIYGNNSEK